MTAIKEHAPRILPGPSRSSFLLPGRLEVTAKPTLFTTILGSCVSVCIYEESGGVGGINHFLFPGVPGEREKDHLRWGVPAIEQLIAKAVILGASRSRLRAKVAGGGRLGSGSVPDHFRVGTRNIECAFAELDRHGIKVVSSNVGGTRGRKLIFESPQGNTWVKELGENG